MLNFSHSQEHKETEDIIKSERKITMKKNFFETIVRLLDKYMSRFVPVAA